MKGNILYALLFASAVLLALIESYGIVSRASSTFLLPLTQDQAALIDSLETRLARIEAVAIDIPVRQGFPYCEPFTSRTPRENTEIGGVRYERNPITGVLEAKPKTVSSMLPGGALQLTSNINDQTGFVYVDLPFSSVFGIRASFEYFAYGGTEQPADGLSFFLFDGEIDKNSFEIGGLGGALGYTPHRYNNNGTLTSGGLTGAYLGIGLDQRNFSNEFAGKLGSFRGPDLFDIIKPPQIDEYINSISLRGPVHPLDVDRDNGIGPGGHFSAVIPYPKNNPVYNSYQFITGKIVNKAFDFHAIGIEDPYLFNDPKDFFTIGTSKDNRVENCQEEGYRKVFIDLRPTGDGFYDVSMWMLVTTEDTKPRLVQIFNKVPYKFEAPKNLKIGFAAANGQDYSFHEIRNVTVEVSTEVEFPLETGPVNQEFCEGETTKDVLVTVPLNNANNFIRCIQLYTSATEAPTPPSFSRTWPNPNVNQSCLVDGICSYNYCENGNGSLTIPGKGTFEITGIDDEDQTGNIGEIQVRFTADPAFRAGVATVWYTVTDNYGQISDPQPININYTPLPKIDATASITGPSCDGRSDGSIQNVKVSDLLPGHQFQWYKGSGINAAGQIIDAVPLDGEIDGIENVNLGKYYLKVTNFSGGEGCPVIREFTIDEETGTPVKVIIPNQEICEGTPVSFTPQLADPTHNASPKFLWWKDINRTKEITHNLTEGDITYEISSSGILTVSGLPQDNTARNYFVEVAADDSQNLCSGQLTPVEVKVLPPLSLSATVDDDLCLNGLGSITVNASGGFGTYTYSLDGGASQSSNVFSGLSPGVYTIEVSAGTNCIGTITGEVKGAPELFLVEEELIMPACDVPNGLWEVSFSGGTPGYVLELFKDGVSIDKEQDPSAPVIFDNLAPGNYRLRITDSNGCYRELDRVLINDSGIPITVEPMQTEICEGDPATILPVVNTTGNVSFKWYKDSGKSNEVVSSATPDASGLTYTIDPVTNRLTVDGLDAGAYSYYLVADGPGYCPDPPYKADIVVVPPITATVEETDVQCFDANDGSLTVVASGADGNFEYSLNNGAFTSNPTFSGLAPGNYTIDIRSTGPNGCVYSTTAEVKSPTSPIVTNTPDILRSSCNLANGSIENLVISGGWGEYTVEWRRGSVNGSIVEGDDSGAKDLSPDTYFLLVTDQKGCLTTFDFEVTEQPQPVFAVNEVEVCEDEAVTFTPVNTVSGSSDTGLVWYKDAAKTILIQDGPDPANPSQSYSIDPSNGDLTVSGLAGSFTPYSFYLHVVCSGQVVKADAMVRIVPKPEFDTEPVTCFGESDGKIRVQGGGHANYRYSVDGGTPMTEAELAAASFPAKSFSIEVSNEGFCSDTFTVEVEGPAAALTVEPLSKVDPGCGADVGVIRTRITGGWQDYTVEVFKDGVSMSTATITGPDFEIKNLAPGDYYLSVTDAEGCTTVSNTINLEYGPTAVEADDEVICEGEVAVFVPEALPVSTGATFEWYKDSNLTQQISTTNTPDSKGHTFEIASNGTLTVSGLVSSNSPISFFVIVTGGNSCPGFVKEVKATVNRMPVLAPEVDDEVCFGEKGTITLKGSAGDGTFEYSLDGNVFQSESSFSVAPGTYTGYVRSGAGCVAIVEDIEVKGPTSPLTASLPVKEDATCNSTDGSLSLDLAGGYGNYVVEVSRNGQNYSSETAGEGRYSLTGLPTGTYSITVRDSRGCSVQVPSEVQIDNLLTPLTAQGDVICVGETATLVPSTTQTGISPIYTWFSNSDGTGQISSGTSGGVSYQLDPDGTLSIDGLEGRTQPYVFYVKISGQGVCEPPLMPVEVKVYPNMNLRVSNPSIVCDPNGTVDLTQFIEGFNPSVYDYQIYSPSGILMRLEDLDEVAISGYYQVNASYKGSNCCTSAKRIQVEIADELLLADFEYQADLGGGYFIPNGDAQLFEDVNFTDSSLGNAIIWNWDFGDGLSSSEQNPTHAYQKKGTYTVTLTTIDGIGCVSETQQVINVLDDYVVMVPTAFTPDGVKNQFFKPQFRGVSKMDLYVFNTWGELIFHSMELETPGWDGTLNGKKVPNGNYVYRATFETRSGEKVERSGVFTLIR